MRVFICWSGDRSGQLAGKLAAWLPKVVGEGLSCDVSLTFKPGREWFPQLKDALARSSAAVICFTPENLASPWMHFEAGVVFAASEGQVFPYFLGPDAAQIEAPLNAIQALTTTETGTRGLVEALGATHRAEAGPLAERFVRMWPELQSEIRTLATPRFVALCPDFERLFQRKTFYEPLDECSDQVWVDRYNAARDTQTALEARDALVRAAARPWQVWLFEKLLGHVDAYARLLRVYLLVERGFKPGSLRLEFASPRPFPIPEPLQALPGLCEHRCREIRHVVFCLTRPEGEPVFADEALAFAQLSLDGRDDEKRLVHEIETQIARGQLELSAEEWARCADSYWPFDRIVHYLLGEQDAQRGALTPRRVVQEIERVDAGQQQSLTSLHYALRALRSAIAANRAAYDPVELEDVLMEVEDFLERLGGADLNTPIRKNLQAIRARLSASSIASG